jgi:mediator of RNA polymerase II transcription subunit 12
MYEQGAVSWAVGGAVCEALAAYAAAATTYLPQPEHVAFALDLMEIALNVHGLIETCIQVIVLLPYSQGHLRTRNFKFYNYAIKARDNMYRRYLRTI